MKHRIEITLDIETGLTAATYVELRDTCYAKILDFCERQRQIPGSELKDFVANIVATWEPFPAELAERYQLPADLVRHIGEGKRLVLAHENKDRATPILTFTMPFHDESRTSFTLTWTSPTAWEVLKEHWMDREQTSPCGGETLMDSDTSTVDDLYEFVTGDADNES